MSINHYRRIQGVSWPKGDGAASAASAAPGTGRNGTGRRPAIPLGPRTEMPFRRAMDRPWLRYVEDMPTRQVAAVLGYSAWRSRR